MLKFVNGRKLWCADKERVRDNIYREISKNIAGLSGYKERGIIENAIDEELDKFSMIEENQERIEPSLFWRLMIVIWIPAQIFILVPYCAIKWLCGKGWYLNNESLIQRFHRRVFRNF